MKFISIESARKLVIDQPVFTIDDKGRYGLGKLVKEEKTKEGISRTFEMALFSDSTTLVTNITHVAIVN